MRKEKVSFIAVFCGDECHEESHKVTTKNGLRRLYNQFQPGEGWGKRVKMSLDSLVRLGGIKINHWQGVFFFPKTEQYIHIDITDKF